MSKESTEIPINRTKAAPRRRVRKLTFWEKNVAAVTFMGVVIGILVGAYGLYLVWEVEPNYQVIISPPDQEQQEYVLTYGSYPEMTQPDFFDNTLKQFKEQRSSFLEADLVNKEIRVFKDGKVEFEAPIAAKGRAGSWWETPAGLYEVQTKSPNHFPDWPVYICPGAFNSTATSSFTAGLTTPTVDLFPHNSPADVSD